MFERIDVPAYFEDKPGMLVAAFAVLIIGIALLATSPIGRPKSTYVIESGVNAYYTNDFKWNEKQTCVVFEDVESERMVLCGDLKIKAGKTK